MNYDQFLFTSFRHSLFSHNWFLDALTQVMIKCPKALAEATKVYPVEGAIKGAGQGYPYIPYIYIM